MLQKAWAFAPREECRGEESDGQNKTQWLRTLQPLAIRELDERESEHANSGKRGCDRNERRSDGLERTHELVLEFGVGERPADASGT